jgi:hypothetical protein
VAVIDQDIIIKKRKIIGGVVIQKYISKET